MVAKPDCYSGSPKLSGPRTTCATAYFHLLVNMFYVFMCTIYIGFMLSTRTLPQPTAEQNPLWIKSILCLFYFIVAKYCPTYQGNLEFIHLQDFFKDQHQRCLEKSRRGPAREKRNIRRRPVERFFLWFCLS